MARCLEITEFIYTEFGRVIYFLYIWISIDDNDDDLSLLLLLSWDSSSPYLYILVK